MLPGTGGTEQRSAVGVVAPFARTRFRLPKPSALVAVRQPRCGLSPRAPWLRESVGTTGRERARLALVRPLTPRGEKGEGSAEKRDLKRFSPCGSESNVGFAAEQSGLLLKGCDTSSNAVIRETRSGTFPGVPVSPAPARPPRESSRPPSSFHPWATQKCTGCVC